MFRRVGSVAVVAVLLVALGSGLALADVFKLTPGDDAFNGTEGIDSISALAGADLINGLGGRDRIIGMNGHDDLYGNDGRDRMFGGYDNDYIVGDAGEDQFNGSFGNDVLVSGNDKAADEVVCGPDEDIAFLSGPDHASLGNDCEEVETFKSFDVVPNPEGVAGGGAQ